MRAIKNRERGIWWHALKFHSMFGRALAVVMVLAVCLMLLFYQYAGHFYQRSYENAVMETGFSTMQMTRNLMQLSTVSLEMQLSELFQTPESGHLMLLSEIGQDPADTKLALNLYNLKQRNDLIQEVWCYLFQSERIFTSDKEVLETDSGYRDLLNWYQQYGGPKNGQFSGQLLSRGQELYWVQGYPEEKPLAVAFVRLEEETLLQDIQVLARQDGRKILLYWAGEPLCPGLLEYPEQDALQVVGRNQVAPGMEVCQAADGNGYFLKLETDISDVQLVMRMEQGELAVPLWEVWPQLWSYLLLALGLILAAAYVLMRCTYFPMRRLLQDLVGRQDAAELPPNVSNELGLIQTLYTRNREHAEHMDQLVRQAGAVVEQRVLSRAAKGEVESWEQLREALCQIDSCFAKEGVFTAVLIGRHYHGVLGERDRELYELRIQQDAEKAWKLPGRACWIPWGEEEDMLLLAFVDGERRGERSARIADLLECLRRDSQGYPMDLIFGIGKQYRQLEGLSEACQDAEQNYWDMIRRRQLDGQEVQLSAQDQEQPMEGRDRQEQTRYLTKAKALIREQYGDSGLSLQSVSEQCGISPFYLSRLFSQAGGAGFADYLNQHRIQRAKELLDRTELTVAEIGEKVGFNSPQSFIRVFKKQENETPGQYRARRQRR